MEELSSFRLACIIAKIMDEKQGKEIEALKISNISVIADYFILCSGGSSVHVKALAGHITEILKKKFEKNPLKEEIDAKNRWCLVDYGDVVVHIMHFEERNFYALEKFWNHASKISMEEWLKETEEMDFNL